MREGDEKPAMARLLYGIESGMTPGNDTTEGRLPLEYCGCTIGSFPFHFPFPLSGFPAGLPKGKELAFPKAVVNDRSESISGTSSAKSASPSLPRSRAYAATDDRFTEELARAADGGLEPGGASAMVTAGAKSR